MLPIYSHKVMLQQPLRKVVHWMLLSLELSMLTGMLRTLPKRFLLKMSNSADHPKAFMLLTSVVLCSYAGQHNIIINCL